MRMWAAGDVARTYDRTARFYDLLTSPMEAMGGRKARERLFGQARGQVLELGIGTGANLPFYPSGVELTGVDISPRMLERARRRARDSGRDADLQVADAEQLPFPDDSFDTVTAACTFCSVADPVQGLREAARVTRPGGRVLLYEHVRPRNPLLGRLFDLATPLTRRLVGPEVNRRTEENVEAAGLVMTGLRRDGIWREIVATPRA